MKKKVLLKKIQAENETIKGFGISRLGLFGSYVRNEATKESDVDLLVEFLDGKKNYDNFIHLAFFLEKVLKKKVDLLTLASLSPYIKPHILAEVEYIEIR